MPIHMACATPEAIMTRRALNLGYQPADQLRDCTLMPIGPVGKYAGNGCATGADTMVAAHPSPSSVP